MIFVIKKQPTVLTVQIKRPVPASQYRFKACIIFTEYFNLCPWTTSFPGSLFPWWKTYAEGNDIISNNCHFNLKHKKSFALYTFSFYFILQPQRTLTFQWERLSVRVIGKHLRVTLFVPAACHRAHLAACHWSFPGSGAFLAHRMHDLVDGSCPVVH